METARYRGGGQVTVVGAPRFEPTGPEADVLPGPSLLAGIAAGPGLAAHRSLRGPLPQLSVEVLLAQVAGARLHGCGGAHFPFADKVASVRRARRPPVVVNACEGEPLSAKDSALAVLAPHLVLDGAIATGRALGSRIVHVVVPGDRPWVEAAFDRAITERGRDDGTEFELHVARPGFVSGQSRAVLELIEGRENLPVSSPTPATVRGLQGRPTVLSNAETFAHVAALVLRPVYGHTEHSTTTTLLTVREHDRARVLEVVTGTPWTHVLDDVALSRPLLVGGFHGRWVPGDGLRSLSVSQEDLSRRGLTLGAGVVLVPDGCPLALALRITRYLAAQTAGRCGPCVHGLSTLVEALADTVHHGGGAGELSRLARLVTGRGACAHPDGTAGMVISAVHALADEVDAHSAGHCLWDEAA
jgi:NADH:ubiquinone oxidoreductase subunit F (NADH-binding)